MRVILTNPENLVGQAIAAGYALRDETLSHEKGSLLGLRINDGKLYSIYWNKTSIVVRDA